MNYQEFLQTIKTEVTNRFDEHFTIKINPVTRNNGKIYDGLVINDPNYNVSPTLYLNPYYHRYLNGLSINLILDDIISTYHKVVPKENFDLDKLFDYECCKKSVIIRLINFDKNIEKLNKIPFYKYHDLAITFCCFLPDFNGESGSICISNELFDTWKIDLDTLLSDAMANTEKLFPYEIIDFRELLLQTNFPVERLADLTNMYILTNKAKEHGSTCILYPGLLEKISKELDSDLLLVPSSIHEFLIIPFVDNELIEEFNSFITEVNATEVADEEILSNHVYYFSKTKKCVIPHY